MMTFEDLIQAYTDCRRHKRSGREALAFEVGLEDNLMALWREVFAAEFRDRVVQHLLVNRIEPVLDRGMIHDSYSCRKGRGTLYGVRRIRRFIAQCSEGYTRDCYVLKCDLEAFRSSVNSYWGLMRHHSSYRLRRCSAERFCPELTAVTGQVGYRKVTLSDPRRRAKRKRRKEISRIECMKINADRYEK